MSEQGLARIDGPVVVVTGPTAAGKTAVALALGERLGAEIVNADSQQVYRYMDVGTAKATVEERARVPHHLIDVVTPDVPYSAGRYAREARTAAAGVLARGRPVLLCGGTGLYIRAFLEGFSVDVGRDPELRHALEAEHEEAVAAGDPGRLHRRLAEVDPDRAAGLHPNDVRRIVRALELCATTGKQASAMQRKRDRVPALHLAVDPGTEPLRERIAVRCDQMIAQGLLWEVRTLRERGYGPELESMRAIGYRHMQPVIEGRETLGTVVEQMKRDTWQFARRQRTWIRAVDDVAWVSPDDIDGITERVARYLDEAG